MPPRKPAVKRARLDLLVVERGLAESRSKAVGLIMAGTVLVNDHPATKPGMSVPQDALLRLRDLPHTYASRGGEKLAGALDAFALEVHGQLALDVGASSGGFTDCLLQRGAARVIALDVGYGQLRWELRSDPRVTVIERMNARRLHAGQLPYVPTLATIDVSFISLRLVLPAVAAVLAPRATMVALVKPQFEVGRQQVGKGGVVRDEAARAQAVAQVRTAAGAIGLAVRGEAESVLPGPAGNREIFLWLERT